MFSRAANRCGHLGKLKAAYIKTPHPFPELEDFIVDTAARYKDVLDMHVFEQQPLKEGFKQFIAETNVTGVLVGVRSTDPYGGNHPNLKFLWFIFHCSPVERGYEDG